MSKGCVHAKSEDDIDVFYKKTISYCYHNHNLNFHVSQTLFSSQDVDIGTRRLLSNLTSEDYTYSKVLDLGCGYGVIGISLKSVNPEGTVHMVDRDSLALDYTRKNLGGIVSAHIPNEVRLRPLRPAYLTKIFFKISPIPMQNPIIGGPQTNNNKKNNTGENSPPPPRPKIPLLINPMINVRVIKIPSTPESKTVLNCDFININYLSLNYDRRI